MLHMNGTICSFHHRDTPIQFFVSDASDLIQAHHIRGEFYEPEELNIISKYFCPGDVFVDIGSNVGNHTVFVAKFLHPSCVISFEANPKVIPILRLNIAINNLVRHVDFSHVGVGLGFGEGWAEAISEAGNIGATHLELSEKVSAIRVIPGDSVLSGRRVDFMKIDVEGMELMVLRGLGQTIKKERPTMFIEVDNSNESLFQIWLSDHAYSIRETFKRYSSNTNYLIMPIER